MFIDFRRNILRISTVTQPEFAMTEEVECFITQQNIKLSLLSLITSSEALLIVVDWGSPTKHKLSAEAHRGSIEV